ncbi:alpha-L-arabinofuranosidase B, catalytic-domain-containing protein [Phaeosphaeriaceae sp. PMI808]|nr:alpha-L-arabinofuranosidase B, catalytic-domain-containing protein [Phaeosphaeriaceae sp. PMI808]
MYAVLDGTHYNGGCCFDYGNAETSGRDTGNGHMETIYFGNCNVWGTGSGRGPWIMADLENGLFSGANPKNNAGDPTISYRFTTAVVKGQPGHWDIRGANAVSGSLSTFYNGNRPSVRGYNPMSKEGAIILGIGGDNSHGAQGTFYEGVMTSGYPSDATENSVQANVVAAKYATTSLNSGPALTAGSLISLQGATGTNHIIHQNSIVNARAVLSSDSTDIKQQGSWTVRTGLGNSACFSFESKTAPGNYLVHNNFELQVKPIGSTTQFDEDATFCMEAGLNGQGTSIRSWNHPTRYLRYYGDAIYVASNGGGIYPFDDAVSFHNDASWVISPASV